MMRAIARQGLIECERRFEDDGSAQAFDLEQNRRQALRARIESEVERHGTPGSRERQFDARRSGSANAYKAPPPPMSRYCRPSSSNVIGELPTRPTPECHSVKPSRVRSASALVEQSPVKVNPESVVSTPALASPS